MWVPVSFIHRLVDGWTELVATFGWLVLAPVVYFIWWHRRTPELSATKRKRTPKGWQTYTIRGQQHHRLP